VFDLQAGLRMRRWSQDDAPMLLIAMRDPLVRHYSGFLVGDRSQALARIQHYTDSWNHGEGAAWALCDAGDQLVGSVRFALTDGDLGTGAVGYWLTAQVRGRGTATAAVVLGTTTVLRQLGWHRIELRHAVENERSCRVARRCGYRFEGILRGAMRYPDDGRWSDEHLHARLAEDEGPRDPGR
jgi:[ribosomal protein S5]-alanine N-acetyltransferase